MAGKAVLVKSVQYFIDIVVYFISLHPQNCWYGEVKFAVGF